MFKNVVSLVKFKNQLLEGKREAKRQAKREAKAEIEAVRTTEVARQCAESCDHAPAEHEATPATGLGAKTQADNFILRRGRKQFLTMARRLQRVRGFTSRRKLDADGHKGPVDKPKFFIDYEEVRVAAARRDSMASSDDDAYVSAAEDFEDDDAGRPVGVQQAHRAVCEHSAERASDEKFLMPEEQCDIPTFLNTRDCARELVDETRRLLRQRYASNPDSFAQADYQRMLEDDWTVSRFLLRRRLDPKRTAHLMENCGKFRRQYLMGRVHCWEFPAEFHLAGGLFQYAPDRVGNTTMYMRIKMYRRVPEITDLFKSLVLARLEQCDTSTGGRGTAIVFDLTECGLQNVDLGFLYWLLNSFRNYCPKGVSYILVLNLPWFLSATAKLAMTWLSATNRRSLRFVQGKEIENFIAPENLPDYLGGTCPEDYRRVPEGSHPAASRRTGPNLEISCEQAGKIRDLLRQWLPADYERTMAEERAAAKRQSEALGATALATKPVVSLVSQASKFIAH